MEHPPRKNVLDTTGFVERLQMFGDDTMVVNAARVSFAKESHTFTEQDGKLITYLAKHKHVSPFFHPQIQFRIKMPIFVAREWFRHTVGLTRNEVSRRYVDSSPECYIPAEDALRERDPRVKQGSKPDPVACSGEARLLVETVTKTATTAYEQLLKLNVAPEVARMILPQSMYTEFIETGSLAAYARIYSLRTDPHAQKEIHDYADAIGAFLETAFPVSWPALIASPSEK